jgi:uncharacterized RDD family membrane protein YckC
MRGGSDLPPRQADLFPSERAKVIPFESLPGSRVVRERAPRPRRQAPRASAPTRAGQSSLDLRAPAAPQRTIYAEAPIALPGVRFEAALVDFVLFAACLGAAAATFHFMGGTFVLTRKAGLLYGGAGLALLLFYHLYWSILGAETPGMRALGLRLLTFDGSAPHWKLRVLRFVSTCLSIGAAGLGLIWSVVDLEQLTWQDHISKTFPTVYDRDPGTMHRK